MVLANVFPGLLILSRKPRYCKFLSDSASHQQAGTGTLLPTTKLIIEMENLKCITSVLQGQSFTFVGSTVTCKLQCYVISSTPIVFSIIVHKSLNYTPHIVIAMEYVAMLPE
ncbi:hypothetical protein FKM82_008912 [Ascaphus truei]